MVAARRRSAGPASRVPNGRVSSGRSPLPGVPERSESSVHGGPAVEALRHLQRAAGNAAVAALVGRDAVTGLVGTPTALAVARQPVDAPPAPGGSGETGTGPELPPGEHFEWSGSPENPKLVVSRSWMLAQGVPEGLFKITGADHPSVLKPIISALVDRTAWAVAHRDEILKDIADVEMTIGENRWKHDPIQITPSESILLVIGMPPNAPIQVFDNGPALQVYVDMRHLGGGGGSGTSGMGAAQSRRVAERVVAAIETHVGKPMLPQAQEYMLSEVAQLAATAKGANRWNVSERLLKSVYGEQQWGEMLAGRQADESTGGAIVKTPGGGYQMPADLSPEDQAMAVRVLKALFGGARTAEAGTAIPLSTSEIEKLRTLEEHPELLAAAAKVIKQGKGKTLATGSLTSILETVFEVVEMRSAAEQLGVKLSGEAPDEKPIVERPVHGVIVNRTGKLVPKQEAEFRFDVTDDVDAFRVAMVNIRWAPVKQPDKPGAAPKKLEGEQTRYIDTRDQGWLNDRTFEKTFSEPGLYDIHAFVNHNFYQPAHFTLTVEVKTESTRLAEMEAAQAESFGQTTTEAKPEKFEDVIEQERRDLGMIQPPPGMGLGTGYEKGTRAEGQLAEGLLAEKGGSAALGAADYDRQIAAQEGLREQYAKAAGTANKDLLEEIDAKLERLRKTRGKLKDLQGAKNTYQVHCQGSYVTRTNKLRGGPLKLMTWFTYDPATRRYHAHMLDSTLLVKREELNYQAEGAPDESYERVMERLFFELSQTYPDGSMSFSFQKYDGLTPTSQFIRFERRTDTARNDMREVVYSDTANWLVNLAAAISLAFPPAAAVMVPLSIAYNAAQAMDQLEEARRTGTDKTGDYLNLGLVALDVIPLVGRARRVVIGGRVLFAIDAIQYAGQAYIFTEGALKQIEMLRDGQLTELAKLHDDINRLKEVNESDPALADMEKQAKALVGRIRDTGTDTFFEMASSQVMTIAPTIAVGKMAEHIGQRRADAAGGADDVDPRRPRPDADPGSTIKQSSEPLGQVRLTDPQLSLGLPPQVRGDVPVFRGPPPERAGVEVHYTLDRKGLVNEVHVRVGPDANASHVAEHARTVELMNDYRGLSGQARLVFERMVAALKLQKQPPPVGSKAWEAQLELEKLPPIIRRRMEALDAVTKSNHDADTAMAARLRAEIAGLQEQLERHKGTFERMENDPGAGYVAAHDEPGTVRLDLPPDHLRNVLDEMPSAEARRLSEWMGEAAFREVAAAGPAELRRAREARRRVDAVMADSDAAKGLQVLVSGPGKLGAGKVLDVITGIAPENLLGVFRLIGRGVWPNPRRNPARTIGLGNNPDRVDFLGRYGRETYEKIRSGDDRNGTIFNTLAGKLKGLDDATAAALVTKVRDAPGPQARKRELGLEVGRAAARRVQGAKTTNLEQRYLDEARTWIEAHKDSLVPVVDKTTGKKAVDVEAAILARAKIQQFRDRVLANWQAYQRKYSPEQLRQMLGDIDRIANEGGLATTWVNRDRGEIAEAFFVPGGGLNQRRLPNPLHPAESGAPGFSRLDGRYAAGERGGRNTGTEWVEFKSHADVGVHGRNGEPNRDAVRLAEQFAAEGAEDWHALLANTHTRCDGIVIAFAHAPDPATRAAMLEELFSPDSPFKAVGFAGEWHERPAGNAMPPVPDKLRDGPIDTTTPQPVPPPDE
jgi:hypothetical protein